jgi:hypothetical protein
MTARKLLKWIHLLATIWLATCVVYLVAERLWQAGFHWWLVFSLSGYSAIMTGLLAGLYVFALFRGIGGARRIEPEHPLTSASWYMGLYVSAPLLGGIAAAMEMANASGVGALMVIVAMGTLRAAFLVWIVLDPLLGVMEMLSPASREHRAERLAQAEEQNGPQWRTDRH